jgi:hypothetical protein
VTRRGSARARTRPPPALPTRGRQRSCPPRHSHGPASGRTEAAWKLPKPEPSGCRAAPSAQAAALAAPCRAGGRSSTAARRAAARRPARAGRACCRPEPAEPLMVNLPGGSCDASRCASCNGGCSCGRAGRGSCRQPEACPCRLRMSEWSDGDVSATRAGGGVCPTLYRRASCTVRSVQCGVPVPTCHEGQMAATVTESSEHVWLRLVLGRFSCGSAELASQEWKGFGGGDNNVQTRELSGCPALPAIGYRIAKTKQRRCARSRRYLSRRVFPRAELSSGSCSPDCVLRDRFLSRSCCCCCCCCCFARERESDIMSRCFEAVRANAQACEVERAVPS